MTTPNERTRAVLQTLDFLIDLSNPQRTPGVPRHIREEAHRLLRHYPAESDMDLAGHACPQWFGIPERR